MRAGSVRRSTALLTLVAAAILPAAGDAPASGAGAPTHVQVTGDGAWSWFSDPRAVRHQGERDRTYLGWVTSTGDVQVASHDHDTKAREVATLRMSLEVDDHANPSILVRDDGRVMAFYSAHAGRDLFYRVSVDPEDVTWWSREQKVVTNTPGPFGVTYPNPIQLPAEDGRIWLFWRGGDFQPAMSTSTDGGRSWAPARTFISQPGQRPYVKYVSDGRGDIHFAFTDGHPRDVATNSVYYARYHDGALHAADGRRLESIDDLPLLPQEADRVYDATRTGERAWVWDIALDADERPVIAYATLPATDDHRYRYARWNGSRWSDHEITAAGGSIGGSTEPHYSGGLVLDGTDPSVAYLSRQVGRVHEIERWSTNDDGATWSSTPITSGSAKTNVRPIAPRGHVEGDLGVLWMSGDYPSFTGFDTSIRAMPTNTGPAADSDSWLPWAGIGVALAVASAAAAATATAVAISSGSRRRRSRTPTCPRTPRRARGR